MKLSTEEKDYLFSKLEYKKKKVCIEQKNELYNLLKGDQSDFTDSEVVLIIKSLEFSFRKRLEGSKPDLNNEIFKSIKSKLPSDIIIVKQSSINYKPGKSATKSEIEDYLTSKKIPFETSSSKAELLSLMEGQNFIKRFDNFEE